MLKSKLKEAKCNESKEVESLKKELEEAKLLNESNKEESKSQEETLTKVKELNERKLERLQKEHQEEVTKLKESVKAAELKFTRLLEANKILSKNYLTFVMEEKTFEEWVKTAYNTLEGLFLINSKYLLGILSKVF